MTATDPVVGRYVSDRAAVAASPASSFIERRDELVELLVLAEHGDESAAGRLRARRAIDSEAHTVCTTIARDLDALRAG